MSVNLFRISSCISVADGPVGFEPEIKWNKHKHCLQLQQGKVYTTKRSADEKYKSGHLFHGQDICLKKNT